jgi:hypothetical protein
LQLPPLELRKTPETQRTGKGTELQTHANKINNFIAQKSISALIAVSETCKPLASQSCKPNRFWQS